MMFGNYFLVFIYVGFFLLFSYIINQSDDVGNFGVDCFGIDVDNVLNVMDVNIFFGFGIGLGLGVRIVFDLDVLLFYGVMCVEVVVDGIFCKIGGCIGCFSFGFNNWYLFGNVYVYVNGEVGVQVKVFGKNW